MTVMTKQHSIGSSDTKNSVIKFIVNVLPETYIPSYVTVAIVGTEVKVVTEVTIFFFFFFKNILKKLK